ncbi:28S ribosomal protein S29, mitochondrial-like [Lytechinus variegatus]|uniref:28S ribosomal protein S29, mitochondrial-like n=1 Tax=Lytechinus variegatus TaxID=7654 RepID=UPI001BB108C9|nr:28S ribosomal protein S29, mitochondrial-like [Lytechinus variegatus]
MLAAAVRNTSRSHSWRCMRCLSGQTPPQIQGFSSDTVSTPTRTQSSQSQQHREDFRTSESDPLNHTSRHIGQYYTIPLKDVPKVFPIGYSARWHKLLRPFQEAAIMVRKPAVEIMDLMRQADYTNPPIKYLMYGRKGSGKTTCLNHVLHFCHNQNCLIVHIPCGKYQRLSNSWNVNNKWDFLDSVSHEGMYDQPALSSEWLKHFRSRNEHFLKEILTSKCYEWSKREQTEAGQPLLSVIDQGLNRPKNATDVIGVVLKELQEQSSSGQYRLILAVKAVNGLFAEMTNIRKPGGYIIPVNELRMAYHFKKMLKGHWTNGAIIMTVDQHNCHQAPKYDFKPLHLLQKQGFEWLDPFVPIYVENYSDKEFESCMQYYISKRWVQTEQAKTEEGKLHLKLLSESSPGSLERMCASI